MMPVDFEGSNVEMCKPKDMTDEQCFSIRAFNGIDDDGVEYYLTAWLPNKEDIEAINAGRPVMLKQCGDHMQPVALYTFDENLQANV